MHAHTHMHIHTHAHARTRARTYTHIHVRTRTHTLNVEAVPVTVLFLSTLGREGAEVVLPMLVALVTSEPLPGGSTCGGVCDVTSWQQRHIHTVSKPQLTAELSVAIS